MALKKPRERGAFFIFCPNTHELSSERLTPLAYNGLHMATFLAEL